MAFPSPGGCFGLLLGRNLLHDIFQFLLIENHAALNFPQFHGPGGEQDAAGEGLKLSSSASIPNRKIATPAEISLKSGLTQKP